MNTHPTDAPAWAKSRLTAASREATRLRVRLHTGNGKQFIAGRLAWDAAQVVTLLEQALRDFPADVKSEALAIGQRLRVLTGTISQNRPTRGPKLPTAINWRGL